MDHRTDDLWSGGPWEQPVPGFTPPPAFYLPPPAPPRRPRLVTRRRRRWPVFVGLSSLILAICLSVVVLGQLDRPLSPFSPPGDSSGEQTHQETRSTEPPSIPRAETGTGVTVELQDAGSVPLSYREIYEKNAPSIVSIEAEQTYEYSTGTGVVLTQDGYIVTNAHVVAGANHVNVAFSDNQVLPASLVGFDADEDLAVLKVNAQGLTPAEFGDSSQLHVGDPVAAIGDPLGYRSTITDGIISSLDREVDVEGITMVLIQTSAAINFGNSGGALINQYGQVVGITTIKIVTDDGSAESLGFAIPSRRVKYVVDTLIAGETVGTGVFGFTVSTRALEGGGLEILSVDGASDAAAKGVQAGDVILSADGQAVTSTQDLARLKLSMGPGDLVTLTLRRGEEIFTVEVALVDQSLLEQGGRSG